MRFGSCVLFFFPSRKVTQKLESAFFLKEKQ